MSQVNHSYESKGHSGVMAALGGTVVCVASENRAGIGAAIGLIKKLYHLYSSLFQVLKSCIEIAQRYKDWL